MARVPAVTPLNKSDNPAAGSLDVDVDADFPDDFNWDDVEEDHEPVNLSESDDDATAPGSKSKAVTADRAAPPRLIDKPSAPRDDGVVADPTMSESLEAGEIEQTQEQLEEAQKRGEEELLVAKEKRRMEEKRKRAEDEKRRKEKEAKRKEEEAKRKEEEAKRKEAEAKRKEAEAKRKEDAEPPWKKKKREKQKEKEAKRKAKGSQELHCEICDVRVTGQVVMDSHVRGQKHQNNMRQLQLKNRNKEISNHGHQVAKNLPSRAPQETRERAGAANVERDATSRDPRLSARAKIPKDSSAAAASGSSMADRRRALLEEDRRRLEGHNANPEPDATSNPDAKTSANGGRDIPLSKVPAGTSEPSRQRKRSQPEGGHEPDRRGGEKSALSNGKDGRNGGPNRMGSYPSYESSRDGAQRRRVEGAALDTRQDTGRTDQERAGADSAVSRDPRLRAVAPERRASSTEQQSGQQGSHFVYDAVSKRDAEERAPLVPSEWLAEKMSVAEWRELRRHTFEKGNDHDKLAFKMLQELLLSPVLGIRYSALAPFSRAMLKSVSKQRIGQDGTPFVKFADYPEIMRNRVGNFSLDYVKEDEQPSQDEEALRLVMDNILFMFDAQQHDLCAKVDSSLLPRRGSFGTRSSGNMSRMTQAMLRDGGRPPRYEDSVEQDLLYNHLYDNLQAMRRRLK